MGTNENILWKHSAILYRLNDSKKWVALLKDDFSTIYCVDTGQNSSTKDEYQIQYGDETEKIFQYGIANVEKMKVKDSFVRWQNDKSETIGVRFRNTETAKLFQEQVQELLTNLNTMSESKRPEMHESTSKTSIASSADLPPKSGEESTPESVSLDIGMMSGEIVSFKAAADMKLSAILTTVCKNSRLEPMKHGLKYVDIIDPLSLETPSKSLKSLKLRLYSIQEARLEEMKTQEKLKEEPTKSALKKKNSKGNLLTNLFSKGSKYEMKMEPNVENADNANFKVNGDDPIWKSFLDVANMHTAELNNPRVADCVESFVKERGGYTYLRQVNDQKLSPQLVDDLNNLAGKVHAISHTPEPPILPTQQPPSPTPTAPETVAALERKKRRAPKPPEAMQQQQSLDAEYKPPAETPEEAPISMPSPVNKRQAPKAPQKVAPSTPTLSGKPPPCFVPPPPPDEPPPDLISSPVGPLSPKSLDLEEPMNFSSRIIDDKSEEDVEIDVIDGEKKVTEEHKEEEKEGSHSASSPSVSPPAPSPLPTTTKEPEESPKVVPPASKESVPLPPTQQQSTTPPQPIPPPPQPAAPPSQLPVTSPLEPTPPPQPFVSLPQQMFPVAPGSDQQIQQQLIQQQLLQLQMQVLQQQQMMLAAGINTSYPVQLPVAMQPNMAANLSNNPALLMQQQQLQQQHALQQQQPALVTQSLQQPQQPQQQPLQHPQAPQQLPQSHSQHNQNQVSVKSSVNEIPIIQKNEQEPIKPTAPLQKLPLSKPTSPISSSPGSSQSSPVRQTQPPVQKKPKFAPQKSIEKESTTSTTVTTRPAPENVAQKSKESVKPVTLQTYKAGEKKPPSGLYAKLKARTGNLPAPASAVTEPKSNAELVSKSPETSQKSFETSQKSPVTSQKSPVAALVKSVEVPVKSNETFIKGAEIPGEYNETAVKSSVAPAATEEKLPVKIEEKQPPRNDEKPTNIVTPFVHKTDPPKSNSVAVPPTSNATVPVPQNKGVRSGPVPFGEIHKKGTSSVKPPQSVVQNKIEVPKEKKVVSEKVSNGSDTVQTEAEIKPEVKAKVPVKQPGVKSTTNVTPMEPEKTQNPNGAVVFPDERKKQQSQYDPNAAVVFPDQQKKQNKYGPNAPVLFPDEQKKQFPRYDPNAPVLFPDEQKKQFPRYDPNAPVLFPDEQKKQFPRYDPNAPVLFPDAQNKRYNPNAPVVFPKQQQNNSNINERHSSTYPSGSKPINPVNRINSFGKPINPVNRTSSFGNVAEKSSPYNYKPTKSISLPPSIPPPPTSPPPKPPQEIPPLSSKLSNESLPGQNKKEATPLESPRNRLIKNIEQHGTPTPEGVDSNITSSVKNNTLVPKQIQMPQPHNNNEEDKSDKRPLTLPSSKPPVILVKKEYIFEATVTGTASLPANKSAKPPAPNVKPKPQRSTGNYTRSMSAEKQMINDNNVHSSVQKKKGPPTTLPKKSFDRSVSVEENSEHNVRPSQLFGVSQTLPRQPTTTNHKNNEIDLRANIPP